MVETEPLGPDDYVRVAEWLSDPEANKFLDSQLRAEKIDKRFVSIMCMNPRNRVFLVRSDGEPAGLVGLQQIDEVIPAEMDETVVPVDDTKYHRHNGPAAGTTLPIDHG